VSLVSTFVDVAGPNPIWQAFLGGLVIATFNLTGAMLVFVWRNPTKRSLDGALGFAAGIMLAASFTSLILPGIEFAEEAGASILGTPVAGIVPVTIGFLLGVGLLDRADRWVPHVHFLVTGRRRLDAGDRGEGLPGVDIDSRTASVILFIVAITLHNMPEGLAVGVSFGAGNLEQAIPLMLAIGFQNVPEGLAVSIAAINAGLDRRLYATLAGVRSGLVEIPLAVLGAFAVQAMSPLLPYAMGFAAGGMLFVISDEIVPETHGRGNERIATLGTMLGVVVMLYLDVSLG
jgi:ZIP family zinc transporter